MSEKHPRWFYPGENLGCPRRFELVRVAASDLEAKEYQALRSHAASCPRCQAILDALGRQREAFLARHPFEQVESSISGGAQARLHRRRLLLRLAPAAVAAAMVAAFIALLVPSSEPSIRTKGEVSIQFYVQRSQGAVPGLPGGIYHENDRIQFVYSSGPHRYLFLVSLDDRGRVSNFNYQAISSSVPIAPGNNRVLEGSIILDDSVGPEKIFAIFSNNPLQLQEIREAAGRGYQEILEQGGGLRDLERLPLPYPQASILLLKQ